MNDVKLFLFNSLSVTTGLVFYSLFVYFAYLIFMKEDETENKNLENKDDKEKEKVDNFDILEDTEN